MTRLALLIAIPLLGMTIYLTHDLAEETAITLQLIGDYQ